MADKPLDEMIDEELRGLLTTAAEFDNRLAVGLMSIQKMVQELEARHNRLRMFCKRSFEEKLEEFDEQDAN